jgi:SAM-dependent methyltransferase
MTEKTTVFNEYALQRAMPLAVPTVIGRLISALPRGPVLDIGCGDGRFLSFCQSVLPQEVSVGLEISSVRLQRVVEQGLMGAQADSEKLPFADGTFRMILMIEVIEHAWHPESMIAEAARVLAPDGLFVLTTPNYPIKRAYDWLSYLRGSRPSPADEPTHFSPFSARQIKGLCQRYFATVKGEMQHIAGEGRVPGIGRLHNIPWIADRIGHKILLVCRNPIPNGRGSHQA